METAASIIVKKAVLAIMEAAYFYESNAVQNIITVPQILKNNLSDLVEAAYSHYRKKTNLFVINYK